MSQPLVDFTNVDTPTSKRTKLDDPDVSGASQASAEHFFCTICLEPWMSDGAHKICSLACGHLYGRSCIEQWLRTSKLCPQCNAKSKISDIRDIFAAKITAIDTLEANKIQTKLADEQEARLRAQTNLKEIEKKYASLKEKYLALQTSVGAAAVPIRRIPSGGQLQEDVADVIEDEGEEENLPKWQDLYNPVDLSTTSPPQWKLRCTVPVSNARVLEYVPSRRWVLASSRVSSGANPHGIKKISLANPAATEEIPIHVDAIRDIKVSPTDDTIVLTASNDKTVCILNTATKNVIMTYKDLESQVWSCSWDRDSEHLVYAGTANGTIFGFDTRRANQPLVKIFGMHREQLHSMFYTKEGVSSNFVFVPYEIRNNVPAGLLTGSFGGVYLWDKSHTFSTTGLFDPERDRCSSLRYNSSMGLIAASFRRPSINPTSQSSTNEFSVFSLERPNISSQGPATIVPSVESSHRTPLTSSVLWRGDLFSLNRHAMIAQSDERACCATVYCALTGTSILVGEKCPSPVLDMKCLLSPTTAFAASAPFAALSNSVLQLYDIDTTVL